MNMYSHPDAERFGPARRGGCCLQNIPYFSQKAKADVAEYDVEDGEVILLCSDGLCGVCRDEEICGIIEEETGNLQTCKEKLTAAALQARGNDNITIAPDFVNAPPKLKLVF